MFAQAGAAAIVLDRDLTVERLRAELPPLLADPARLAAIGRAARSLARPDAATALADAVAALATPRARRR
jgi:UDP-N-acetylglucosamine:LPS N-acetylglucosamine transferase